jgi:hypothetical protein
LAYGHDPAKVSKKDYLLKVGENSKLFINLNSKQKIKGKYLKKSNALIEHVNTFLILQYGRDLKILN